MPAPRRAEVPSLLLVGARMTPEEVERLDGLRRPGEKRSDVLRRLVDEASGVVRPVELDAPADLGPLEDAPASGETPPLMTTPRARALVAALLEVATDREALVAELRDACEEALRGR